MGFMDEQTEVRKIYAAIVPMLQAAGHEIIDCNSNAGSESEELNEGTNKANANNCDIFASIHMNAAGREDANGTEVLLYDTNNLIMNQMAGNICNRFSQSGFPNRGVKFRTDLHDLNVAVMPSMIIETMFCTGRTDANRYTKLGPNGTAKLIAEGMTGKNISASATPAKTPASKPVSTKPQVRFGVKTLHHGTLAQGVQGKDNDAIVAIQIGVNQGSVKYRVHCGGIWLPAVTGANWKDPINGYAGDDKTPIDALQVYYYTDIKKAGRYYSAVYCVKPHNQKNKLPWVEDTKFENNDGNGTAGIFGVPFTELCITLN